MAQVVAQDGTVKNAKAANRQASTKILALGLQWSKVQKSSFLIKEDEITHKTVVLKENFLWGILMRINCIIPLCWDNLAPPP